MLEDELNKCKNDISYFIEKYCVLVTPNGTENIRLSDSQKKYLECIFKRRKKYLDDLIKRGIYDARRNTQIYRTRV